ncbi:MAG: uroporphyrinogen decarboxylase family protein [Spirochaetota bacterium]
MTPRERVLKALRKEPVDRVPVFMWFHPETLKILEKVLEIPKAYLGDAMGNDIHQTWVNNNYAMEGIIHETEGETHRDDWGIVWEYKHSFNQIKEYPFGQATIEEVLAYHFPYDKIDTFMKPMADITANSKGYFLGCDVSPCAFEMYWRLRGMENTFMDFALNPKASKEMIDRCIDFSITLAETAFDRFPLDWLWTGDDVASQQGMLFSPALWRGYIKPGLKRLFDVGKRHSSWVAYHCCGALRPIIPDLIEIGLNVLNPVQGNCPGMNPLELKKEFGEELFFMGGLDTQYTLPRGNLKEVRKSTMELIEGMTSDGGGYILAANHSIPPETPLENIFALYAVAGISKAEILDKAADIRQNLSKRRNPGVF